MIVDIQTATYTSPDGVPITTWVNKETRIINWSPIGFQSRIQMGIGPGGETWPQDSRIWLEADSDITAGNRLSEGSGTTYYRVLSVFKYEDHTEAELSRWE